MRALALVLCLVALTAPAVGDDENVDPLLAPFGRWLAHEDGVLRAIAAFELRRHATDGAILLGTRALERERDGIVIACLLGSLAGRARPDLVAEGGALLPGLLLRLVEHEHPVVRDRAWEVLRALPKKDPGQGVEVWRAWWLGARAALDQERQTLLDQRKAAAAARAEAGPAAGRTTPAEPDDEDLYEYVARLRRDGLEVVIVLDHTGSMAPVIGAAAGRAASLVRRLAWLVPRFRAGLVTYDDQARFRLALTTDGQALRKAFRKVSANGGGDWEEGVDKGIALALRQEKLAWSRRAHRVIVVIGDAPPHGGDVNGLLRRIRAARDDVLYDHPIVVNTVSTSSAGVDHFGAIAKAGGGLHVTLGDIRRLEEELVAISFGAAFRDRVRPWLREIDYLKRNAPK